MDGNIIYIVKQININGFIPLTTGIVCCYEYVLFGNAYGGMKIYKFFSMNLNHMQNYRLSLAYKENAQCINICYHNKMVIINQFIFILLSCVCFTNPELLTCSLLSTGACVRLERSIRNRRRRCRWRNWLPTCQSSSRTPLEFETTADYSPLLLNESWTAASAAATYTRLHFDVITSWDEVSWRFHARFFTLVLILRSKERLFYFVF